MAQNGDWRKEWFEIDQGRSKLFERQGQTEEAYFEVEKILGMMENLTNFSNIMTKLVRVKKVRRKLNTLLASKSR